MTTLPDELPAIDAQPGSASTAAPPAAVLRNSRRRIFISSPSPGSFRGLLCREPAADELDLLIGVTLRQLMHYGGGLLAGLELLHLADDVALAQAGEALGSSLTHAVGAVTVRAGGSEIAGEVRIGALRNGRAADGGDDGNENDGDGAHEGLSQSRSREAWSSVARR